MRKDFGLSSRPLTLSLSINLPTPTKPAENSIPRLFRLSFSPFSVSLFDHADHAIKSHGVGPSGHAHQCRNSVYRRSPKSLPVRTRILTAAKVCFCCRQPTRVFLQRLIGRTSSPSVSPPYAPLAHYAAVLHINCTVDAGETSSSFCWCLAITFASS